MDLRVLLDPRDGWDYQAERAGRDQLDLQVTTSDSLLLSTVNIL